MAREIIDFHTHPWLRPQDNICYFRDEMPGDPAALFRYDLERCGITRAAGAPIRRGSKTPEEFVADTVLANDDALKLAEALGDFYIPGMTVHPADVRLSCEEIERMHKAGVKLIGELVP